MMSTWKSTLLGLGLLTTMSVGGCTFHARPGVEVTAGYDYPADVYAPVYYDRGYYEGPNWVWFGPDHHRYWEHRDIHERRWHDRHWH